MIVKGNVYQIRPLNNNQIEITLEINIPENIDKEYGIIKDNKVKLKVIKIDKEVLMDISNNLISFLNKDIELDISENKTIISVTNSLSNNKVSNKITENNNDNISETDKEHNNILYYTIGHGYW